MALDIAFLPEMGAFFLVFAIVLGILTTAKIFGGNKAANVIIAAVFGLFAAIYEPFVVGVQEWLPIAAVLLIIVFFVVLLKKLFGGGSKDKQEEKQALPMVVALVSLLIVLISQWNTLQNFLPPGWSAENVGWGLAIVVVLAIFWIVYSRKPPS